MTIYTFTSEQGKRYIYNSDRKLAWAVVTNSGTFGRYEVYGNKGAAVRSMNSALYANKGERYLVPVTVATETELAEYLAQEEEHRQLLIKLGLIKTA